MKKLILTLANLLIIISAFAQAPEKMNYQAVARDLSGLPFINTTVNLQFDILQGSATGAVAYSETQSKTTNQFGLFTAEIGSGTIVSGTFSSMGWGLNPYYLRITVNGDVMPATQLLSVPYALYSKESANGPAGLDGLNCWDTNGNGIQDASEDINTDGLWDALDCRGDSGVAGIDGLDINWLGMMGNPIPAPNTNDAYYNTTIGTSFIWNSITSNWDTLATSPGGVVGDNWGSDTVNVSGNNLIGNGTVANPLMVIDNDTSLTNEIQNLSWNTVDSNVINIDNGSGISLASNTPTLNQVLTWNGANWVAQNLSGGAFNTNGTETVLNNITDNVGIGVATPNSKLTVLSSDTSIASFVGTNPIYSAITVSNTPLNPNAGVGMILLTGSDTGAIGLNPTDKQLIVNNSTTGGHLTLSADSSVISYAEVLGQNGQKILEKADTIISFGKTTNNVININQGSYITDSLYVIGSIGSVGDVLTNDGFGQAQWKPSSGGSLWTQGTGNDIYNNTDSVGIGVVNPTTLLHVAGGGIGKPIALFEKGGFLPAMIDINHTGSNTSGINFKNGGTTTSSISSTSSTTDVLTLASDNVIVGAGGAMGKFQVNSTSSVANPTLQLHESSTGFSRIKHTNTVVGGKYWITEAGINAADANSGYSVSYFDGTSANNTFIVYGDKKVGVNNLAAPLASFHVMDDSNVDSGIASEGFSQGGKVIIARNNFATPNRGAVLNGEEIGRLSFSGYGTSIYGNGPQITSFASENYTNTTNGSDLVFSTVANGTTNNVDALRILNDGTVEVISNLRLLNGAGTAGQVLTSDAAGNATWQVPGGATGFWSRNGGAVYPTVLSDSIGIGTLSPAANLDVVNSVNEKTILVNNTSANTNSYLIDGSNNGTGTGNKFGSRMNVPAVGGTHNTGGWFSASGASTENIGVLGESTGGVGATRIGLFGLAAGGGPGVSKAVYGYNAGAVSGTSYAGHFVNQNGGSNIAYGIRSDVNSGNAATQYGVYTEMISAVGGTKYGIYSDVQNATTNWAGYFAAGNVYIADTLVIPTNAGAGRVLTSDAAGNATWQSAGSGTSNRIEDLGNQNTYVDVDLSGTDTDSIRFATGGTEYLIMENGRLHIPNTFSGVYIGEGAGSGPLRFGNTAVGASAMQGITAAGGRWNTALGLGSLNLNDGNYNLALGAYTFGGAGTGGNNTIVGARAASGQTAGVNGSNNAFLGARTGFLLTTGSNNVLMGYEAGRNVNAGSGNVMLGYQAGFNETGSDKLYIENSNSVMPLIYGDFANDSLKVNGSLSIIDGTEGANKVLTSDAVGNATWQAPGGADLDWTIGAGTIYNTLDNIGIGTTAPTYKLDVDPVSSFAGQIARIRNTNTASTNHVLQIENNGAGDGINIAQTGTSPGTKNGISSTTSGVGATNNFGGNFSVSGALSVNTALRGFATASGGAQATGIYATAGGTTSSNTYGVYGQNFSSTTAIAYAGYFQNLNNTGSGTYGVRSDVSSTNTNNQYGFYAGVNSASGGTKYGIYTSVTGGTTNWAAYFASGDVYVGNGLVIPTGASAGHVLTSDAAGNATWQASSGGTSIYSGSGSLSGARTVTQAGNTLTFNSTATNGFNINNNVANNTVFNIQNLTDGTPGTPAGSVGAKVLVSAANTERTGIFAGVTGTGTANQVAVWAAADGVSSGFNRGVNASARNSTNTNIAGDFTATSNTGENYGLRVSLGGTGTGDKYGLRISSAGTTTGNLYGLYLVNNGSGTKYGVYSFGEDRNYFDGNVGIGTATPTAKLDVRGSLYFPNAGTPGANKVLTSDAAGNATWQVPSGGASLWNGSAGSVYLATAGDYVGLGGTSPGTKLDIYGSSTSTAVSGYWTSPETTIKIHNSDQTNNNFSALTFATTLSNAASSEMGRIAVQNVDHTIGSESGDFVFSSRNAGAMAEKVRIKGTGDVGIGTANPAAKLDVIGRLKVTDGSQGLGKVLVSDATGLATWRENQVAFETYVSNALSIATGIPFGNVLSIVSFDAEIFDEGNVFDPSAFTNDFTAKVNGVYSIEVGVTFEGLGGLDNIVEMGLVKNGSATPFKIVRKTINAGERISATITVTTRLAAGDKIRVEAVLNSAGAVNILPSEGSWFSGHLVYQQ